MSDVYQICTRYSILCRGGTALNCGTYESLMVLKYFQAFETHPLLVCILVYMVLKYFPQCYTHPPLAGILVYTVLK